MPAGEMLNHLSDRAPVEKTGTPEELESSPTLPVCAGFLVKLRPVLAPVEQLRLLQREFCTVHHCADVCKAMTEGNWHENERYG